MADLQICIELSMPLKAIEDLGSDCLCIQHPSCPARYHCQLFHTQIQKHKATFLHGDFCTTIPLLLLRAQSKMHAFVLNIFLLNFLPTGFNLTWCNAITFFQQSMLSYIFSKQSNYIICFIEFQPFFWNLAALRPERRKGQRTVEWAHLIGITAFGLLFPL